MLKVIANDLWTTIYVQVSVRVRELKDVCVEFRIPSAMTNPYLALTAILASGMQGLKQNMTLPEAFDPEVRRDS